MTYGVYSKDLHSVSLEGVSLETAKKYCWGDKVVCSEKQIRFGTEISIKILWCPKDWRWQWRKYFDNTIRLGPLSLSWHTLSYTWADKIVYDPKKEGGAK